MTALGRRFDPDPSDHKFLMRRKLAVSGTVVLPTQKVWAIDSKSLDQANTSTCVGHAWNNFLRCAPIRTTKGPSPFDIYRKAVVVDPWPENDNEATLPDFDPQLDDGTSVRAGAEAVTQFGRLKSYLWGFQLTPVVEWLLTEGPVVVGFNWYSSMGRLDSNGFARITPGATIEGGHAFLVRGADTKKQRVTCENSWGDDWGKKGTFFLSFADLERLIHEDGEACTAIEQKLKPANPPAKLD